MTRLSLLALALTSTMWQTSSQSAVASALRDYTNSSFRGIDTLPDVDPAVVRRELERLAQDYLSSTRLTPIAARHYLGGFAAEVAIRSVQTSPADKTIALLEWGCLTVRGHRGDRDDFDDLWFSVSLAVVEVLFNPAELQLHIGHVKSRSPFHPDLSLVQAIAQEQRSAVYGLAGLGSGQPGGQRPVVDPVATQSAATAERGYRSLLKQPDTGAEARLRLGRILIASGDLDEAVAVLSVDTKDNDLERRVMSLLLRGVAERDRGRLPPAEEAFRAALSLAPRASSASSALAGVLFLRGESGAATKIIQDQFGAESSPDPWSKYWMGNFRNIDRLVAQMRRGF